MSTPATKLRPSDSPLTKLKALWRIMPEDQREGWRLKFVSETQTQAQLRDEVKRSTGVHLKYDSQLNAFRDWDARQLALDREAEAQAQDEAQLLNEHPDWSLDKAREQVLKRSYQRAVATGDFKLGLAALAQDRGLMEARTDRDKFEFDATKRALARLPELNAIHRDASLDQDARIKQARLALFGEAPE